MLQCWTRESREKEDIMAKETIKLEKPLFPEKSLEFENMFANPKIPELDFTDPFSMETNFKKMFEKDMIIPNIEIS